MPKLDGVELTRKLLRQNPDLPVIIITGYSEIDIGEGWKNVIVMHKPVSAGELMSSIDRMLTR
jgi:FixJ family two-component response regulator